MAATPPTDTDRTVDKGHGTEALGPSNSSDSGSDVAGAGALLGDTDLSADSDAEGTGERAEAGGDNAQPPSRDVAPDRVLTPDDPSLGLTDGPQSADGTTTPERSRAEDVERGDGPEREEA